METKSPLTCPYSVTTRRNPHRKARPTPSNNDPPIPKPSSLLGNVTSFPIDEILSIQIPQSPTETKVSDDNLQVFLRIRPLNPLQTRRKLGNSKPLTKNPLTKKKSEVCVVVNDSRSITLSPPLALQDSKKIKSVVYEGFSHVFSADSTQAQVYERMVNPLVEDFLCGKSRMFAALGPSGSGKTHTVFGSIREPGMVPLILRNIFKQTDVTTPHPPRTFYISMFEICSEKGKGERMLDLFPEGSDIFMHHSTIKGLQESVICDVAEAEALIARGMIRRSTAMTNTNSQSSRSQCIINIRYAPKTISEEDEAQAESAVFTIVDLAGAEREKRTGNQGARLLESNFINNTSMVFGLCLRSLLEHQKNPKKKLQKHFQNSLLTRYLRDYLEGKKRMTLILTVKSGEEDYLDTSFLLRQASPYMQIKFNLVEKPSTLPSNKRQFQAFVRSEQHKRAKVSCADDCEIEVRKGEQQLSIEETVPEKLKNVEPFIAVLESPEILKTNTNHNEPSRSELNTQKIKRNSEIMQNFAKALWNVLKEYKNKLAVAESEVYSLRIKNARYVELERELQELKSRCSCARGNPLNSSSDKTHNISEYKDDTKILHESNGDAFSTNHLASEGTGHLSTRDSPIGNNQMQGSDRANNAQIYAEDPNHRCIQYTNKRHDGFLEDLEDAEGSDALKTSQNEYSLSNLEEKGSTLAEAVDISSQFLFVVSNVGPSTVDVEQQNTELNGCINKKQGFLEYLEDVEDSDALITSGNEERLSTVEETGIVHAEVADISSESLFYASNISTSTVEVEQQSTELNGNMLDPLSLSSDDKAITEESKDGNEQKHNTFCQSIDVKKCKRKLLPASSILLRDVSYLNFNEENERPKGNRGEKKMGVDERYRTQGSSSLLRLLEKNLHL